MIKTVYQITREETVKMFVEDIEEYEPKFFVEFIKKALLKLSNVGLTAFCNKYLKEKDISLDEIFTLDVNESITVVSSSKKNKKK